MYVCKSTARKGGKENPQKFHREEKKEKRDKKFANFLDKYGHRGS